MKRTLCFLLSFVLILGIVQVIAPAAQAESDTTEYVYTMSDAGIDYLKKEEGFSKYPYYDYGQYTVGYGTKCPDDMLEEYKANGITEEAAEILLRNHLSGIETVLNKKLIEKYKLELSQNQFDALVSFTYNLGTSWIYNTDSIFFNAIVGGATGSELIRAFSLYCNAGGKALAGLVRRRLCEANIYLNAEYSRTRPSNFGYVYYNKNGGSGAHSVQGFDTNEKVVPLEVPTYEGHTFMGWYTAQINGTKVTELTKDMIGDTLYAHWDTENGIPLDPMDPVTVTVTATDVNLRKGPGTNYTIVGQANKGDKLVITQKVSGSGYEWGESEKGWIALKYTDFDTASQEPAPTEPTPTEPAPTEPAPTEPAPTEPAPTEPAPTEPAPTEPAPTEPAPTEPAPTEPTDPNALTGTVKVSDTLRVRSGPGTGYKVVGYLNNGDKVTILETKKVGSSTWGKISTGWISMSYVTLDQNNTTPSNPPANTETPIATGKIYNVKNQLRIRKGPGTSYAIAGYLNNGDKVSIFEEKKVGSSTWYRIDKGWISKSYVKLDEKQDETVTPQDAITGTIKVSNKLTIRKGPGTSYASVGSYKNGTKVTILETKKVGSSTWGRTDKGWISMSYVTVDKFVTITADCLRVRKSASSSAKIVGYYYEGDVVQILSTKKVGSTTWGKTDKGWISMAYTK